MTESSSDLLQRDTGEKQNRDDNLTKVKKTSHVLSGADGIRALACLAVIIHHVSQKLIMQVQSHSTREILSLQLLGNTGVSVFFVLSGFLLSYPFWKQYFNDGPLPSIKQYTLRRAARIIPGYYVSLAVCSILVVLLHVSSPHFGWRLFSGVTFTAGFHYITFFPNTINSPFWSISFEVFCYLLMPVFMFGMFRLFKEKRTFLKALVFWIGVFALILFLNQLIHIFLTPGDSGKGWQYGDIGGAKSWIPNYNPVGFFGHFAIGIVASGVAARLFLGGKTKEKLKKLGLFDLIGAASLIGSIVFLWSVRHAAEFSWSLQHQPYYFPFYASLIGITLAVSPHSRWVGKLLDNPFFKYTAKVSFGLYIWHYLVIFVVGNNILKEFRNYNMANMKSWAVISLGVIAVSYLIATLSFMFVEKPVLDWAHRRKV